MVNYTLVIPLLLLFPFLLLLLPNVVIAQSESSTTTTTNSILETYFPILLAAFAGFVFSFFLMIYKKKDDLFDKTRHQSVLTTVNVGNIQEQMKEIRKMHEQLKEDNKELKEHIDNRLDKLEDETKEEFKLQREKIDKISTEGYNLNWRVGEIENKFRHRGNGSGGSVM
jgi:BMFP domain-containing protein YqiC